MKNPSVYPDRTILPLLNLGVDAIKADLATATPGESVRDDILAVLPTDEERAKAREYFIDNAPDGVMGYPRRGATFPLYSLTLTSDSEEQRWIGTAEHAFLDENDKKTGDEFDQWTRASFTIFVYTTHPDICAWYYRVLRRICNVGIRYLITNGLDNPTFSGAEMAPDPRFAADNLFVRRLTLTVEYNEAWTDQDTLWTAINGSPEAFITDKSQISNVHHEDITDPVPGGVHPYIDAP